MITLTFTDNQKAIINSGSSFKEIRLEFPDHEIPDIENNQVYLDAMSLEESIFEGDVLKFGECNGSLFKIRVADFDEDIQNARMNVYVHYTNENLGEVDVPFGKYIVSNVERTSDRRWRDITATDYMSKFDVDIADWYNNTLYPTSETTRTVKEIRLMLCSYIGVNQNSAWDESALSYTIDIRGEGTPPTNVYPRLYRDKHYLDTLTGYVYVCVENDSDSDRWDFVEELYALINDRLEIGKTIETQTLKGRDLLKAICEINACFGHFDWDGVLKYITIEFDGLFPSDTLYPSNDLYPRAGSSSGGDTEYVVTYKQDGCQYADYDVQDIDSVAIMKEDGDLAVHVDLSENYTNRYNIVGNFLLYGFTTQELEDIAETILNKIGDCSYRPNTTTIFGGVYMEMGQDYVVNAKTYVGSQVIDKRFYTYLLKRTITGIQAMYSTLEATGEPYQPKVASYDVERQIRALQGKSASYKRDLESLTSEYEDFAEETSTALTQTADAFVLAVNNQGKVALFKLLADRTTGSTNFIVDADNISLEGKTINLTSDDINITSNHFSVDKNGSTHIEGDGIYKVWVELNVGSGTYTDVTSNYNLSDYIGQFSNSSSLPTPNENLNNKLAVVLDVYNRWVSSTVYIQLKGSVDPNSAETPYPASQYYNKLYINLTNGQWYRSNGTTWKLLGVQPLYNDRGTLYKCIQNGSTYAWGRYSSYIAYLDTVSMDINGYEGFKLESQNLKIEGDSITSIDNNINSEITVSGAEIKGNLDGTDTFKMYNNDSGLIIEGDTVLPTLHDLSCTDDSGNNSVRIYDGMLILESEDADPEHRTRCKWDNMQLIYSSTNPDYADNPPTIIDPMYVQSYEIKYETLTNISDKRLKENFRDITQDYEKAYYELQPLIFNYISKDINIIGLVAQDVETILSKYNISKNNPFINKGTHKELGEIYTLDYTKFVAWNMHMIQKQHKEIQSQQQQIDNLKDELATLKEQVAFLVERSK